MRQGENDAGLVGLIRFSEAVGVPTIGEHEKSCEVVLVVLDGGFDDFESIAWSGLSVTDGSVPVELQASYSLCRTGGVVGFDDFELRMLRQVVAALPQGNRV